LFAQFIGDADGTFDALTDGVPVGKKYDGDKACVGRWLHVCSPPLSYTIVNIIPIMLWFTWMVPVVL